MEKPIPPADGECCESACEPCVWDSYYEEMRLWQEEQKRLKEQEKNGRQQDDSEPVK
ncbi:hypothetical protein GCM10009104_18630 [Marinobacterium maritimum]|uniref:Oxidoreductase-like domain-containing protein n=2 Tax=Marinobacterium maritimum TaxID=500162 RepID=A0ABP3TBJ5_9GAMM